MKHSRCMRVGIDATVLARSHTTGIGRLIHSLVSAMAATDIDCEFTLLYRLRNLKHAGKVWKPRDPRFHIRFLGGPLDRFVLTRLDVFHSTYQRMPPSQGTTPYLGTLHDIYFASDAAGVDRATSERWIGRYRDVVRRSRLIMTLSDYSKCEVVDRLGAEPERVRVVVPAAADAFHLRTTTEVVAARKRYGLERPFVLFAGGGDPRKNLAGALRALALAAPQMADHLSFAIAGAGEMGPVLRASVPAALMDRVHVLGFVPDDAFAALMTGCTVFFFPTLFEGFGLPALEAMSCGAPVVTSSTTSLPEVCGDAALLVNPQEPIAMAAAVARVVNDSKLCADLRQRGLARARQFSWSRAAEQTLALYREIVGPG